MKKLYLLTLLICITSLTSFAQRHRKQRCNNPMSNYAFQQRFTGIQQQLNEANKLKTAINLVRLNCLTSAQVKEVTLLFQTDQSRIEFVKEAYLKTYDRGKFHHVYDAFVRFKNVAKAHASIMKIRQGGTGNSGHSGRITKLTFPNWNYPGLINYRGKVNCKNYLSNTSFTNYAQQINQQKGENAKYQRAWQVMTSNCMTTAQIMKFTSLVSMDNNRMALLKIAFDKVYDADNYPSSYIVLSNASVRQEYSQYLKGKMGLNEKPSCLVTDKEYGQIAGQIKLARFSNTKFNAVSSIFKTKQKCYSITQLKSIGQQFSFSSDKMKFAKFAYDYAHKKDDYYQMADIFRSPFDKQDFMKFLGNKKK